MNTENIAAFWLTYLASLPPDTDPSKLTYTAWSFGDNPALADQLCELVISGKKTGTCTSLGELQANGEPIPEAGSLSIILDGSGSPAGIIRTTEVTITSFDQVSAAFAAAEGEGDGSLACWRENHWHYFSRVHAALGLPVDPTMELVCERFKLVCLHPLFMHDIIT